jgi:hypothetical protein
MDLRAKQPTSRANKLPRQSFKFVREGAMEIIHRLDEFRASIAHVRNRAVFEIPEILERIMESTPAHDPPRHGRDPRPEAAAAIN